MQFKIVPFDGDGPGLSALMGGHIDAYPCNLSACYSHVKAAKLRALAAFAKERISYLPEVPTTVELGINVTYASIRGFAGPKGLDKRVVDRFAAAVKEAVESPEFKKTAEDMAFWVEYLPPEEFARLLKDQDAVADRVITAYAGK